MCSFILLTGLIALIIFSPLAVGSVYIVTYSAMEMLVFGLLLIHIWTSDFSLLNRTGKDRADRSSTGIDAHYLSRTLLLGFPLFLFLLVGLFQLVPLPFGLLRALSPGTAGLYEKLGFSSGFHPLTLSVYSTTVSLLQWFAYAGAFALVATFAPTERRLRNERWILILVIAIFSVAFFEAVYGIYIGFNRLDSLLWFRRRYSIGVAAGTWINPDHFAGFINMGFLCSCGLFAAYLGVYKTKGRRIGEMLLQFASSEKALFFWMLVLGLLIMVLAAAFSLSRMGQVSLVAALAFMIVIYSLKNLNVVTLTLIIVLGCAVLWGAWKGLDPVIVKWGGLDAAYPARTSIWNATLKLSRAFPVLGTGLGTFELAYPPYDPDPSDYTITTHAHNDYLEILSETGLVGFLLWLSFYAIFLYSAVRLWFGRHDVFVRGIGAGGIAATIAMLAHSLADFNLQIPSNALLLFIIMGLTWRVLHTSFQ